MESGEISSQAKKIPGLKYYIFVEGKVPICDACDPEALNLISKQFPVLLRNTRLIDSALHWDIEYLERHASSSDFTVFQSESSKFKYYDEQKIKNCPGFVPSTTKLEIPFSNFAARLREWKTGHLRIYLQQALSSTVGEGIVLDYVKFNWPWIVNIQKRSGWGSLTSNLLLISQGGNITPSHYDEQHNLFAQIRGYKRFIFFPPEQFENLYPHPFPHPHDRQSQIDFDEPDYARFPNFHKARGLEVVVGPGDVLYIPAYWWHYVESLPEEECNISVTFWYKAGPTGVVEYPLKGYQKVAIMRNIEKILVEALQNPQEVGPLLRAMVLGRYTQTDAQIGA